MKTQGEIESTVSEGDKSRRTAGYFTVTSAAMGASVLSYPSIRWMTSISELISALMDSVAFPALIVASRDLPKGYHERWSVGNR
jgi:hypothetical protein